MARLFNGKPQATTFYRPRSRLRLAVKRSEMISVPETLANRLVAFVRFLFGLAVSQLPHREMRAAHALVS
jgi:hypothetical protein